MNLHHISFSPTSEIANLKKQRGVARCCQLQSESSAVIKKETVILLINNGQSPSVTTVYQ